MVMIRAALVLACVASCASARVQSKNAAWRWLQCPEKDVEPVADDVYRGCGREVYCVAGVCRTSLSWQQRFASVSERFSAQFSCELTSLHVMERETDYVVQGCGRNALCTLVGECIEYQGLAATLARARATFSRETSCPEADVSIAWFTDGFRALGCGRAASCVTVDGPCLAIALPSCTDVAEQRYDECLALARADGRQAIDRADESRQGVAQSIEGTVAANRLLEECRFRYQEALSTCAARPR